MTKESQHIPTPEHACDVFVRTVDGPGETLTVLVFVDHEGRQTQVPVLMRERGKVAVAA